MAETKANPWTQWVYENNNVSYERKGNPRHALQDGEPLFKFKDRHVSYFLRDQVEGSNYGARP